MSRGKKPGCNNPPNVNNNTAFLDSEASLSLLGPNAACKRSEIQEPNRTLGTPSKQKIMSTETLELLLKNYQRKEENLFGYQIFLTTLWQNVSW